MSNYNSLKTTIDANIKQNGRQEITGQILNSVLNQMVNILGTGYQFAGVATLDPATDPGTPDAKVFYIANGKGTYTNFGGLEVTEDEVVVLYWDSSWHKVSTGIASQEKLTELESEVENATTRKLLFENGFEKGYFALDGTETFYWPGGYKTDYIPVKKGTKIICHCVCATDALAIVVYNSSKVFVSEQKVVGVNASGYFNYEVVVEQDGFVRCYTDKTNVLDAWENSYILVQGIILTHNDIVDSRTKQDSSSKEKVWSAELSETSAKKVDNNDETLNVFIRGENFVPPVDSLNWENGTIDANGDIIPSSNIIIYKTTLPVSPNKIYHKEIVTSNYAVAVFIFNRNGDLLKKIDWDDASFYTDSEAANIMIAVSRTDDANFTPESAEGVSFNIYIEETLPKELDSVLEALWRHNVSIGEYLTEESIVPSMSPLFWEQGTIGSDGQEYAANNRLRTQSNMQILPDMKYLKSSNLSVVCYDQYGQVVNDVDFADSSFITDESAMWARLIVKNNGGTSIRIDNYDGGDILLLVWESLINKIGKSINLNNLSGNISPLVNDRYWEFGTLIDGQPSGNDTIRLRTKDYFELLGGRTYSKQASTGFQVAIDVYDKDKAYITEYDYNTNIFCVPQNARYFKLILKREDGSTFPSINNSGVSLQISNSSTIAQDIADVRTPSGFVPSYYKSHLAQKIDVIRGKDLLVGNNGDSLVFITDSHFETNTKHSPSLIRDILEKTNIRKVFHGGDTIDWGEKSFSLNNIRTWYEMLSFTDVYLTLGNHDINITDGNHFTNKEVYALFMRAIEHKVNISKKLYYYFDNPEQKIRYIILDGHWPTDKDMRDVSLDYAAQLNWLDSVVSELDSTWDIVVFQHIIYGYSTIIDNIPTNIRYSELAELLIAKLDSYQNNPARPRVLAIITGHLHYDYGRYSENGHYPIIATTTDSTWGFANNIDVPWSHERTIGTINEQAFDVIQIDRDNNKIYCTRIGYGSDREFNIPAKQS